MSNTTDKDNNKTASSQEVVHSQDRVFECYKCHHVFNIPYGVSRPTSCPACGSSNIHRIDDERGYGRGVNPDAPCIGHGIKKVKNEEYIDDRRYGRGGMGYGRGMGGAGRGMGYGRGMGGAGRGMGRHHR